VGVHTDDDDDTYNKHSGVAGSMVTKMAMDSSQTRETEHQDQAHSQHLA
jgi:hypothetical protein